MTSTDAAVPADDVHLREWADENDAPPRRRRRRRPAPKANPFWRFLFPLVVAGLGLATFQLWKDGTKAVLDSTDGTLVEVVTDPAAPGYEAFVDPTPTMLVIHTDDADTLVGVTVLARTLLDNGGQAVLLSAELASNGLGGPSLADRYSSGGAEAIERDVGSLFGFGFVETATYNTRDFGLLLGLVEPLPFALLDDLIAVGEDGTTETFLTSGGKQLDGEVAATVYGFRNPNEADANRNERQVDMWESWLLAIGRSADIDTAVPPFEEGLAPYLRAFGQGQSDVQLAPAVPSDVDSDQYRFTDSGFEWLAATAERMTPLPIAAAGSDTPSIRLLDGTGDQSIAQASIDAVARHAQITVVGNAAEFGVTETTVSYHDEADATRATVLAETLGATVEFDARPDEPVDLTVVIGTDWEAP